MEREGSLPHLQESTTGSYSLLDEPEPHLLTTFLSESFWYPPIYT
jgi:hypothetical protein